jgi:hypothetical protein
LLARVGRRLEVIENLAEIGASLFRLLQIPEQLFLAH